jgi:poly-gamma-glutamate synthesis protein (capsule biosynthesis protein)
MSGAGQKKHNGANCTIFAVGDTSPPNHDPHSIFAGIKDFLRSADIRFAQAERVFSKRGSYHRYGFGHHSRRDPKCAEAYKAAGFDVISTASNHSGDWGHEGFVDTVRTMERLGINAIGSGRNIARARQPAIVEKKGVKVGFLAYASVIPPQTWATEEDSGVAPLRVDTHYEMYEYQPGCPARIITIPWEEDVRAMQEDIRKLRSRVDCVVVSHHWGVHGVPRPLAQYQPTVARYAVDAGADVLLGHHTHCMQGVELMKDGARHAIVFYGLGNFAMPAVKSRPQKHLCAPNGTYTYEDAYYRELIPGHDTDTYKHFWVEAYIARIEVGKSGLERISLIPTFTESMEAGQPRRVLRKEKRFKQILTHLKWASEGLPGAPAFKAQGDEIEVYARK